MKLTRLFAAARRKAPAIVLTVSAAAAVTAPAVAAVAATSAAPAVVAMSFNHKPDMSFN